ncbi:MAG: NAD(P)-binding domain-containing protein [Caldilineaceae bacterium]|nr:NAD(P)-binding domain-containing protein [Caldilineaceae bacterium]
MTQDVELLIVGAGPFGLALAAEAQALGVDYLLAGKPMEFWEKQMPAGMYLRSACDWHLDPRNDATIERFLAEQGLAPAAVEPLSLAFYLTYVRWFQAQKQILALPLYVTQLDITDGGRFAALLEDGRRVTARAVAVAVGFKYFKYLPADVVAMLPAGSYEHTCDRVDFAHLRGKRCLILGGRQSAFEWAALLHEAGAAAVHVVHRHASPAFAAADWSWVNPLVENMVENPGWFRQLPQAEKEAVSRRLWAEGRLKVEPWLEQRVMVDGVTVWPETAVAYTEESTHGDILVTLSNGEALVVDNIILATGYKVSIESVPFLAQGNMLPRLATRNGFPVLDEHFQTNIPGLFITSMAAGQDFGPFFGFTISVRTSARLIGQALTAA